MTSISSRLVLQRGADVSSRLRLTVPLITLCFVRVCSNYRLPFARGRGLIELYTLYMYFELGYLSGRVFAKF